MYTSLLLLTVSGVFLPTSLNEPVWFHDYTLAQSKGWSSDKPLAVFIGAGKDGWHKLSREGAFDARINKLLRDHYICVYLDRNNGAADYAKAFGMQAGLVLSNRGGRYMAYRHAGTLSNAELAEQLSRYADGDKILYSNGVTRSAREERVSYQPRYQYHSGSC
ncbi:MAG: hypothetical protein KatS3mg105_1639 [Gemmatales bacterium]|nr:MAG: hypothetical protein KatS3mg105_1639 [Gemmatales bacterium]